MIPGDHEASTASNRPRLPQAIRRQANRQKRRRKNWRSKKSAANPSLAV